MNTLKSALLGTLIYTLSAAHGIAQISAESVDISLVDTNTSQKVYHTWEGDYRVSTLYALGVEGLSNLYVVVYRCPGRQGTLVEFSTLADDHLNLLREAEGNPKGVTPELEGIEVFPAQTNAEIIVRWRHPGNGGHRTIEKYRFDSHSMVFMGRSHFRGKGFGMKWVTDISPQTELSPVSARTGAVE